MHWCTISSLLVLLQNISSQNIFTNLFCWQMLARLSSWVVSSRVIDKPRWDTSSAYDRIETSQAQVFCPTLASLAWHTWHWWLWWRRRGGRWRWAIGGVLSYLGETHILIYFCVCVVGGRGVVLRDIGAKKILFGVSLELKKTYLRQYSSFTGIKSGIGDYGTFFYITFMVGQWVRRDSYCAAFCVCCSNFSWDICWCQCIMLCECDDVPVFRDNWISDNRKVQWSCIRQAVLHLQFLLAVEHLM